MQWVNPRLALYQGVGGNASDALIEIANIQLWAQYTDATWVRISHSVGPTAWELYGDVAAGGTPRASKFVSGGIGTSLKTYLGTAPPTGFANQASSMFQMRGPDVDSSTWVSPHTAASLRRLLVIVRARIDPATYDAAANYVIAAAIDKTIDGTHTNNVYDDIGFGRFKVVEQGWRAFAACTGPNATLDVSDPFPVPTGVLSDAEYVIHSGTVAPPPPGGTITPPPPGTTRNAALWPGGSATFHNRAVGQNATYASTSDAATADFLAGGTYINGQYYSMWPTLASAGDPTITMRDVDHGNAIHSYKAPNLNINLPLDGDATTMCVDPTRSFVDCTWRTAKTGTNAYDCHAYHRDDISESGTGTGGSIRASGLSPFYGSFRIHEIVTSAPHIPHVIHAIIAAERAKSPWIWPAVSEDGYSAYYSGNIPMGTVFAIPPSVSFAATGATNNAWAQALYAACVNYGLIVGDTGYPVALGGGGGSNVVLSAEAPTEGTSQLTALRTAWSQLKSSCRRITNHTQSTPKGGGTPLLPDPPPIG